MECEPHRRLELWIYDLRTNKHFTLKENPLKRSDLDDFVSCWFGGFNPDKSGANRFQRKESERFRSFSYEELTKREPVCLACFPAACSGSKTNR